MCLVSCPHFSHAVAILMLVLPNDWVEGSQSSPPVSNDDSAVCPQDLCCLYSRICCSRAFHSCRISCHGLDQQTPDGGPTTDRTSLRNSTSRMWRTCCRILRCPAAKQAIGVTVASNNFIFEFIETFLSKNIHLFEWKARAAACKWYVSSPFPEPSAESMQPNHFCVPKLSFTTMVCPARVVMWSGGCASVVKISFFEAFNFRPVLSSVVIKASSNDAAPSAVSLKIKMTSANRRSSKGIHLGNRSPIRYLRPMHANPS